MMNEEEPKSGTAEEPVSTPATEESSEDNPKPVETPEDAETRKLHEASDAFDLSGQKLMEEAQKAAVEAQKAADLKLRIVNRKPYPANDEDTKTHLAQQGNTERHGFKQLLLQAVGGVMWDMKEVQYRADYRSLYSNWVDVLKSTNWKIVGRNNEVYMTNFSDLKLGLCIMLQKGVGLVDQSKVELKAKEGYYSFQSIVHEFTTMFPPEIGYVLRDRFQIICRTLYIEFTYMYDFEKHIDYRDGMNKNFFAFTVGNMSLEDFRITLADIESPADKLDMFWRTVEATYAEKLAQQARKQAVADQLSEQEANHAKMRKACLARLQKVITELTDIRHAMNSAGALGDIADAYLKLTVRCINELTLMAKGTSAEYLSIMQKYEARVTEVSSATREFTKDTTDKIIEKRKEEKKKEVTFETQDEEVIPQSEPPVEAEPVLAEPRPFDQYSEKEICGALAHRCPLGSGENGACVDPDCARTHNDPNATDAIVHNHVQFGFNVAGWTKISKGVYTICKDVDPKDLVTAPSLRKFQYSVVPKILCLGEVFEQYLGDYAKLETAHAAKCEFGHPSSIVDADGEKIDMDLHFGEGKGDEDKQTLAHLWSKLNLELFSSIENLLILFGKRLPKVPKKVMNRIPKKTQDGGATGSSTLNLGVKKPGAGAKRTGATAEGGKQPNNKTPQKKQKPSGGHNSSGKSKKSAKKNNKDKGKSN
jgi:hypothetical protein